MISPYWLLVFSSILLILFWKRSILRLIGIPCPFVYFFLRNYSKINQKVPRFIHLIYLPWDRHTQRLKSDSSDFDWSFYHETVKRYPSCQVLMWTWPLLDSFMQLEDRDRWTRLKKVMTRPMQLVDYARFYLVYHFGGIYLQYGSRLHTERIENLFPSSTHSLRLLTEFVLLNPFMLSKTSKYAIRQGRCEEVHRIMNQFFVASPQHPFLLACCDKIVQNVERHPIVEDYDILYTSGPAMISELYDQVGKKDPSIECSSWLESLQWIMLKCTGSWRMDRISSSYFL